MHHQAQHRRKCDPRRYPSTYMSEDSSTCRKSCRLSPSFGVFPPTFQVATNTLQRWQKMVNSQSLIEDHLPELRFHRSDQQTENSRFGYLYLQVSSFCFLGESTQFRLALLNRTRAVLRRGESGAPNGYRKKKNRITPEFYLGKQLAQMTVQCVMRLEKLQAGRDKKQNEMRDESEYIGIDSDLNR